MKKEYTLLFQLFDSLYPNQLDAKKQLETLLLTHTKPKPKSIWFKDNAVIAETIYVDRFSNTLNNLKSKIEYFKDLGINLVHFMPLLKTRAEENDGGYAVVDFNDVDKKFGTLNDLKEIISYFHQHEIYVMIDYVVNHVAKEHVWAKKAVEGNLYYQNYFIMFDDDTIPKQYDETVPLVIPERKPTNFTYHHTLKKYIYTSFSDYQWDLNFKNPYVFIEVIKQMQTFSNWGIDMIRLDAIPFMWKTLHTQCRNLPEVHTLIQMIRLIRDMICPELGLLGEAIVEPHEIVKYFGSDEHPECDMMYNANLMVDIWHTVATQDTRLLSSDQMRYPLPKHATWLNYARCHDDIGWGFNEDTIRSFGQDPFLHKQFLISFYNGSFPTSFSKGIDYQKNEKTLDARTNGMLASLVGLEQALELNAPTLYDMALKRIMWIHALLMFYQGAPMIYAGDDIGMMNDVSYLNHTHTKYDSRWIHRPHYDWNLYENIKKESDPRHLIYKEIKHLTHVRLHEPLLKPFIHQHAHSIQDNPHVLILKKIDDQKVLYGVFNASDKTIHIQTKDVFHEDNDTVLKDILHGRIIDMNKALITLSPYEYLYIK